MAGSEQGDIRLTRQQRRALLWWDGGEPGDPGSDDLCWGAGIRPWPTLDNLERLGLCEYDEWDEDVGRLYRLTELGAQVRKGLRP